MIGVTLNIVLCMVKSRAEAVKISEKLVSEGLAACVSAVPGASSVYRWKGKIEKSKEVLLIAKTSNRKLGRLIRRVKELHSYEVPEIIAAKVARGLPEYLRWVEKSTR
ncbi:MAG: divalent-cation tolerance protein CutA [Candidatus Hadarchaeota archaeon]